MSSQLILSIKEAMVRFKDKPIFEDLNFNLHQKSRKVKNELQNV